MAAIVEVKYYNSFWLKKVIRNNYDSPTPGYQDGNKNVWPGLPWETYNEDVEFPIQAGQPDLISEKGDWFIEEARIKGGFNEIGMGYGVRAYINEKKPIQSHRFSSLIYSGVFNSRTNVNQTNVFSIAEDITKTVDPNNGSIQKLFAEDTNLTIFQENKVSKALIDKDAIYSAEGGGTVTSSNLVIGQVIPYLGKYGIGMNPESFAQFGYRKYFIDKNRGVVLRLSRDGITEISEYGMKDFFRDKLTLLPKDWVRKTINWDLVGSYPDAVTEFTVETTEICNIFKGSRLTLYNGSLGAWEDADSIITDVVVNPSNPSEITITVNNPLIPTPSGSFYYYYKPQIIGGWDNHNRAYVMSIQPTPSWIDADQFYSTIAFDENPKGWVSRFNYKPLFITSLQGAFYSAFENETWRHHAGDIYGNFYDIQNRSSITFIFNKEPSMKKVFQTINYEGDSGWQIVDALTSSFYGSPTKINKDFPDGSPTTYSTTYQDEALDTLSYVEGLYVDETGYNVRTGFDRKENLYTAAVKSKAGLQAEQVLNNENTVGIKGYYATVELSTDNTTDVGGAKEIWSVGTTFARSS